MYTLSRTLTGWACGIGTNQKKACQTRGGEELGRILVRVTALFPSLSVVRKRKRAGDPTAYLRVFHPEFLAAGVFFLLLM